MALTTEQQTILTHLRSGIDWTHDGPVPGETTCDCDGLTEDSCEYGREAAASMRTVADHLEAGEIEEAEAEEEQWGDSPATQSWQDITARLVTLSAAEAVAYAEAFDARDQMTEEGTITLELEDDLDGDQVAVIVVPEHVETPTRRLYAGTYLVAMPPEYDWEIVTGEDIIEDRLIRIIQVHAPAS
jgi:hypothetical protein